MNIKEGKGLGLKEKICTRTVPLTVYGHQKDTQCQICDLLYKLQSPQKDFIFHEGDDRTGDLEKLQSCQLQWQKRKDLGSMPEIRQLSTISCRSWILSLN